MIQLLFIFYFANGAVRIKEKEGETKYEIEEKVIELQISHNQWIIQELNNKNIYDIDLRKIEDGKLGALIESPYLSSNLVEDINLKDICIGIPKQPLLEKINEYKLVEDEAEYYYSDMLTIPERNLVFLINDQLKLTQIVLSKYEWVQQRQYFDIKKLLNITSNEEEDGFFSCTISDSECGIFTRFGAFWFNKSANFSVSNQIIIETHFIHRQEINEVSTSDQYIAIACGKEGVDFYLKSQQQISRIKYVANLANKAFGSNQFNIIAVKIRDNRLSVLDKENGLFIFNYNVTESQFELLLHIQLPRGISFDHYKDTYIVIAETYNNIQYITELLIDFELHSYYVNRIYIDNYSFKDIEMNSDYAFILSDDLHLMIRHSIFNGFQKVNKELIKYFYSEKLIKLDQYKKNNSTYYIGVSRTSIHQWLYEDSIPHLMCNFESGGQHFFQITSNSTTCGQLQEATAFYQCQVVQDIQIKVSGALVESDKLVWIIVGCLGGVVEYFIFNFQFCLSIIFYMLFRKYSRGKYRLFVLRKEAQELKKYGQFQEVDQSSSMVQN